MALMIRPTRKLRNWATMTPARAVMVTLALLAVLAAGGLGVYNLAQPNLSCPGAAVAAGVQERGRARECTGVTDGSYPFMPKLKKVEAAILKENRSVAGKSHVTIALLMPFTSPDPTVQAAILHVTQGAYVAQFRANHNSDGKPPLIRLILANPGQQSTHWRPVAEQLLSMTGSPDYLRAVTGIGVSTARARKEVGWLTSHDIPVVGGSITADSIANGPVSDPFPGLVRVAATNTDEADALVNYAKVKPGQAILVEDTRAGDDYITTLKNAFSNNLREPASEPEKFSSPPNISQNGATSNQFTQMVGNICALSNIKWIFFAGRQVQLRLFINELTANPCRNRQYVILTGDAASHLAQDRQLDPKAFTTGVTLYYAALSSPDAWKSTKLAGGYLNGQYMDSNKAYYEFVDTLRKQATRVGASANLTVDLADGQAIINYDAVRTAVTAIRNLTTTRTAMIPPLRDIISEWHLLNAANKIRGASGWICLDNHGNPYDKAIPIVTYKHVGRSSVKPVLNALAWPTGTPPPQSCTAKATS